MGSQGRSSDWPGASLSTGSIRTRTRWLERRNQLGLSWWCCSTYPQHFVTNLKISTFSVLSLALGSLPKTKSITSFAPSWTFLAHVEEWDLVYKNDQASWGLPIMFCHHSSGKWLTVSSKNHRICRAYCRSFVQLMLVVQIWKGRLQLQRMEITHLQRILWCSGSMVWCKEQEGAGPNFQANWGAMVRAALAALLGPYLLCGHQWYAQPFPRVSAISLSGSYCHQQTCKRKSSQVQSSIRAISQLMRATYNEQDSPLMLGHPQLRWTDSIQWYWLVWWMNAILQNCYLPRRNQWRKT